MVNPSRTSRFALLPDLLPLLSDETAKAHERDDGSLPATDAVGGVWPRNVSSPSTGSCRFLYTDAGLNAWVSLSRVGDADSDKALSVTSLDRKLQAPLEKPAETSADSSIFTQLKAEVHAVAEDFVKKLEEQRRLEEEEERKRREEERKEAERRKAEELRLQEERRLREDEERRKAEMAQRLEEERRKAEEIRRAEEIQRIDEARAHAASTPAPPAATVASPVSLDADGVVESRTRAGQGWRCYLDTEFAAIKDNPSAEAKAFRLKIKKEINLVVNQLASTAHQVKQASAKMTQILVSYHPKSSNVAEARQYKFAVATLFLSVFDSAEAQISSNPQATWGMANFLARLCGVPEFRPSLEAAFYDCCTYCIPMYITKAAGMSIEEFNRLRGQGKNEDELAYFQRMSCYLRLWLGFIVAVEDAGRLWDWWSRFVNTKPKRISPFLLFCAFDVSAFLALRHFGRQFTKLVKIVINHFLPKLQALQDKDTTGTLSGAMAQLDMIIGDFKNSGRFPTPDGYQMKHIHQDLRADI